MSDSGSIGQVLIHDLSRTGLLIETSEPLRVGSALEVQIGVAENTRAKVVWRSERFFGCQFDKQISQAAVSGAVLRSPHSSPRSTTSIASELRALTNTVEEILGRVDDIVEGYLVDNPVDTIYLRKAPPIIATGEIEEDSYEGDRVSFSNRLRLILATSVLLWVAILWGLGAF